jgi:hypothetical protein
MPQFTIEGRMKQLPDIQRNFLFEVVVPGITDVTTAINQEDLIIRVRSAVIPQRGNEPIESNFMGMKQFFPGKPTFSNSLNIVCEETEDQKITKALYDWQQKIFDINPSSPTAGSSQVPVKRRACKDIFLLMYKYNGTELEKKVRFVNAFPETVDDVSLGFAENAAVQYSVTFRFDYWVLE